ncbi:MAG: M50 family metallopeptidase [Bacteroidota bacterium]
MNTASTRKEKIVELTVLLLLLIFSFVFWDTKFVYPIKLFVVLLHEQCHALAALLTGGKIESMNIGFDLGGSCQASGGNAVVIASAGYIGSLILGLLFFLSPNNIKIGRWIVFSLSLLILVFTIVMIKSVMFILIVALLVGVLITASFYMSVPIVSILIRAFGLLSAIYVLFDIKNDLLETQNAITDASIISNLTGIPEIAYGLIWLVISLTFLVLAVKFSYAEKKK